MSAESQYTIAMNLKMIGELLKETNKQLQIQTQQNEEILQLLKNK